jgi:carbonic anhydrase
MSVMSAKKRFIAPALAAMLLGVWLASYAGAGSQHGVHWTYEGDEGPQHWGHISRDYAVCLEGKSQSPVDITGASEEPLGDIAFGYAPMKLNAVNNGHTVQVNYDAGSSIRVDGADYQLVQFHFHAPSEHKVAGMGFGMELHLVHRNARGELAVVGVLLAEGRENPAYAAIFDGLPRHADDTVESNDTVNASELLPSSRAYYRYQGSLTTPPCSEGVTWLVLKEPVELSKAQIEAFRSVMDGNSRPVQPLNGRRLSTQAAK